MSKKRVFYWCGHCTLFPMISDFEKIGEHNDKDTGERYNDFNIDCYTKGKMLVKDCLNLSHEQVLEFNSKMSELDNKYEKELEKFDEELQKKYEPKIDELLKLLEKK